MKLRDTTDAHAAARSPTGKEWEINYRSEGSLNQHVKLKHPEYYYGGQFRQQMTLPPATVAQNISQTILKSEHSEDI